MIPYGRQDISIDDINAVVNVLKSDWLTQGPAVPLFEKKIVELTDADYAVAVNSATSALHVACMALGLGPGDYLWTSPNTFVASANCALYCGASVDFVDIDSKTYNLSVEHLQHKLEIAELEGRLPKIVVAVHYAGQPCYMDAIHKLGQRYGFRIIEDASHAIGARYQGEPIGNCKYSDVTVFSFHPVKIITTAEGGAAVTCNEELATKMRQFRSHGITSDPHHMQPMPDEEIWNYQQICLGYNYRMTDIQAALGISQLTRLDWFIQRRHSVARVYDETLASDPFILPWQSPESQSSYHLYPIRVRASECGKNQRQVYNFLRDSGVQANLHYIPVHTQPYFQKMGFRRGDFPEAEHFFREAISLPIFPTLSDSMQTQVISALCRALS